MLRIALSIKSAPESVQDSKKTKTGEKSEISLSEAAKEGQSIYPAVLFVFRSSLLKLLHTCPEAKQHSTRGMMYNLHEE